MEKIISALSPEVAKVIRRTYPVAGKRTPLWFYTDEVKSKCAPECSSTDSKNGTKNRKIKKSEILRLWSKMEPESKRKYFNMARFDEVRFKEQKSLWMAKVGTLLATHGDQADKLIESVTDIERLNREFLVSFDRHYKNYEQMIQIESTRDIYKDVISRVGNLNDSASAEEVIASVPKEHRALLVRPRRPLGPFLLYISDHREKIRQLCRLVEPKVPVTTRAAQEWFKLTKEERKVYEDKYSVQLAEYYKALKEFYEKNPEAKNDTLSQASKERKSFRKSLRRRLHEFTSSPVNVRNSFNFFVMDKRQSGLSLTELTRIWRELPEEEKSKYKQMADEDMARYYRDKAVYDELICKFNSNIFGKEPT